MEEGRYHCGDYIGRGDILYVKLMNNNKLNNNK